MIVMTIETKIYIHVDKCNDSLSMWETLCKLYEDTGLSRKIGLLRTLIQCRLDESSDMQAYIDSFLSTSNKLTGIGFNISDEWIGAILLAGLTDEYRPMIMSIESNNQTITSDLITQKLIDMQTGAQSGEAFYSRKNKFKKKNKKANSNSKKKTCYICDSDSHLANTCPQKKVAAMKRRRKKRNPIPLMYSWCQCSV